MIKNIYVETTNLLSITKAQPNILTYNVYSTCKERLLITHSPSKVIFEQIQFKLLSTKDL